MSLAQLSAQSRRWRRAGLCYSCGGEVVEGHKLCQRHLDYHRELKRVVRAARRAAGLCLDCGEPANGMSLCVRHLDASNERRHRQLIAAGKVAKAQDVYARRHRQAWRAAGLCIRCGQTKGRDADLCVPCQAEKTTAAAELRAERRASGLCKCGRRATAGLSSCRKCRKCWRLRHRARRDQRVAAGFCLRCDQPAVSGRTLCAPHRVQVEAGDLRRKLVGAGVVVRS